MKWQDIFKSYNVHDNCRYNEFEKVLEEAIDGLINRYFDDAGEYVQEKFTKTIIEKFIYLRSVYEIKEGIHITQLNELLKNTLKHMNEMKNYAIKVMKIEECLINEVKREVRHYNLILKAIKK